MINHFLRSDMTVCASSSARYFSIRGRTCHLHFTHYEVFFEKTPFVTILSFVLSLIIIIIELVSQQCSNDGNLLNLCLVWSISCDGSLVWEWSWDGREKSVFMECAQAQWQLHDVDQYRWETWREQLCFVLDTSFCVNGLQQQSKNERDRVIHAWKHPLGMNGYRLVSWHT